MKLNRAFVGAASILVAFCTAHAQPSAIQQLQNMQQQQQQQLQMPTPELRPGTNAPELYVGENADVGPQRILRVAGKSSTRKNFDINFDSQFFYSDNANFSGAHSRIASGVFVNTAQIAYAPDMYDVGPGKFAPAVGFSSQWYNYTAQQMRALNLDFVAQTAFINLRYLLGNWQIMGGVNYTRLINQPYYSLETYNEWLPNLSVQRSISISETTSLIVGDAVSYHFSHVPPPTTPKNVNDHFDDTVYFTLNWQATSHLAVQPYYRFQYSNYKSDTAATASRRDYLDSVGITLLYSFNQNASLRTYFAYTTKLSSDPLTPTYDEINGGFGATLDIRF